MTCLCLTSGFSSELLTQARSWPMSVRASTLTSQELLFFSFPFIFGPSSELVVYLELKL